MFHRRSFRGRKSFGRGRKSFGHHRYHKAMKGHRIKRYGVSRGGIRL